MVFFHEHTIVEPGAVVSAATAFDRIFLGAAQTRNGFASVEQARVSACKLRHIMASDGGRARQRLQKIQGGSFATHDGPGRTFNFTDGVVYG